MPVCGRAGQTLSILTTTAGEWSWAAFLAGIPVRGKVGGGSVVVVVGGTVVVVGRAFLCPPLQAAATSTMVAIPMAARWRAARRGGRWYVSAVTALSTPRFVPPGASVPWCRVPRAAGRPARGERSTKTGPPPPPP